MRILIALSMIFMIACMPVYRATHLMRNVYIQDNTRVIERAEKFVCEILDMSYTHDLGFSYTEDIDYFSIRLGDGMLLVSPTVAIVFIPDDIEIHVISDCQKQLYALEMGKRTNNMTQNRERTIHKFFDEALKEDERSPVKSE